MPRRGFEHLYAELCLAVNQRVSRYALWLLVWESGADPDELSREQAHDIVDYHLTDLLHDEGLSLDRKRHSRLSRNVLRFDPRHPTPQEWLTR